MDFAFNVSLHIFIIRLCTRKRRKTSEKKMFDSDETRDTRERERERERERGRERGGGGNAV